MTRPDRISARTGVGLLAAPILVMLVLLVFLPPDGTERAAWAQFIGRFHPLVVHLPIALILLVPVMEVVGRDRPLPISARFGTLCACPCPHQRHRSVDPRMVPRSKRRFFWAAGHSAHVGRSVTYNARLAMLGLARARWSAAGHLSDRPCGRRRRSSLDGLPRWPSFAGRTSPD